MRGRKGGFLLAIAMLAITVTMLVVPSAAMAGTGTGAWYWPTGTEDFGGMSGWWDVRGSSRHVAQDMKRSYGSPVYAIGDGLVLESKYVSGYGPGGGSGGAVVILHKTATGAEFKALYGHVYDLRYAKGDTVKAGAVIARINGSSPNHLHFGIHPGRAYPSDNNPFRGHTDSSQNPLGWVSPVAFLRANPRLIPYCAPSVPVVATIATTETATWVKAASGWVYWSEEQEAEDASETVESTRYAYAISLGALTTLDASATVPETDTRRYVTSLVAGDDHAVRVQEILPRLSLGVASTTPFWGSATTLSGSLTDAAGRPFKGAAVRIQRQSGTSWTTVATSITGPTGAWSAKYAPTRPSTLRAVFVPPAAFSTAISSTRQLTPKAALTVPTVSSGIVHGRPFTVKGTMRPKHASGGAVVLQFQRHTSAGWVSAFSASTRLSYSGSANAWLRYTRVPRAGWWRVRAYHAADAYHVATYSQWRTFTAK